MIKNLLILLYLCIISSALTIDFEHNPDEYWRKYENQDISSEVTLLLNQNIRILSENQKNDLCTLEIIESVKSYIYNEKGEEIITKSKIINKGTGESCLLNFVKKNETISVSDIIIKEGGNNIKDFENSNNINEIKITFNLRPSKVAIISYRLNKTYPTSFFYRLQNVKIEKRTKYTFRAKKPLEIIGSKYGEFNESKQKNGALYLHYNDKYYNFSDIIIISVYGIKFKSELIISLKFNFWNYLNYMFVPNMYEYGNNRILSYKIKSNLNPNEYNAQKDQYYTIVKSDKYERNFDFIVEKIFESKVDNEWKMDDTNFINTCTIKTNEQVKLILANDKSEEKNYIKLGRWVYKNINYNENYTYTKMSVDEILEKKVGVCYHLTRLYNSFLNCIGIETKETTGYVAKKNDPPYNKDYHAWTLAKINEKWIPLDATWNIFVGKLHVGHIFLYYDEDIRKVIANGKIVPFNKYNNDNLEKENIESLPNLNPKNIETLSILEILSREGDDDNEGDFDIEEIHKNDYDFIIIIIIFFVIVFLILYINYTSNKKENIIDKESFLDKQENLI